MVVLGIRQVQAAALSLLMFEHLGDREQALALREAAGRSILSGMLSRSAAGRARMAEPEEAFVCSMLRRLGEYLAIYYLPEEHAAIRAAVQTGGESEEAACRRVLGLDFAELGMGVAREWQLPAEILHCMRPLLPGTLAAARSERDQLAHLAGFGDELATLVLAPPSPEREQALAALEQRYSRTLPIPRGDFAPLIAQALRDSREYAGIVGHGVADCEVLRRAEGWPDDARSQRAGREIDPHGDAEGADLPAEGEPGEVRATPPRAGEEERRCCVVSRTSAPRCSTAAASTTCCSWSWRRCTGASA